MLLLLYKFLLVSMNMLNASYSSLRCIIASSGDKLTANCIH